MTPKQEQFCAEYLIDLNATRAAIRAGYSEKTAYSHGARLLKDVEIQKRIENLRKEKFTKAIMTAEEVEYHLSLLARGEEWEDNIVTVGCGEGVTEVRHEYKQTSHRDRLKALELMGKRNNLFSGDTNVNVSPVVFVGIDDVPD